MNNTNRLDIKGLFVETKAHLFYSIINHSPDQEGKKNQCWVN